MNNYTVILLFFLHSSLPLRGESENIIKDESSSVGNADQVPSHIYTLLRFSDLQRHKAFVDNVIERLGGISKNNSFRIWAFDIRDHRYNYVIDSKAYSFNDVSFYSYQGTVVKSKSLDRDERMLKIIDNILKNPISFPKSKELNASTTQHIFIIERFIGGQYSWAIREFHNSESVDYFNIIDIFSSIEQVQVRMAWKVEE